MKMNLKYIVVKYATPDVWHNFFDADPGKGCDMSHSAHDTWTGHQVCIEPYYLSHSNAEVACFKMNEANPSCCYAVCPVLE